MTRFARARGSKSSNQRLPHPPTDWSEMKQQLLETKQPRDKRKNVDDEEEKIKKMRIENYEKFLHEEVDNKNNTEWAEFEVKNKDDDDEAPLEVSSKQAIVEIAKPVLKKTSGDNQDDDDDDDDDEDEAPLEASSKQPIVETAKPVLKKTSGDNQDDDDDDDDDAPLEVSSKQPNVETVKPVQKKPKIKKTITVKPQEKNKILKIVERENRQITRKKKRQQKQLVKKLMKNGQINEENLKETTGEIEKSPKISVKNKLKKQQAIVDDKNVMMKRTRKTFEETEIIHGRQIIIKQLDGYRIKKDDYKRIMQLKKDLKAQNQPKKVIAEAVKRVRRTAEKKLKNEYRKVCFKCRKPGHQFTECPQSQSETNSSGVCFKCGSTEHTHYQCRVVKNDQFRYATCFICGDEGHISRQCPQNTNGVYPKGGNCLVCGSVEHLKKDCQEFRRQQQEQDQKSNDEIVVGLLDKYKNPEIDDFDNDKKLIKIKKVKKINFNK